MRTKTDTFHPIERMASGETLSKEGEKGQN